MARPKKNKEIPTQIAETVLDKDASDFLHETYLPYAWYVIQSRALTGLDGLKPVQRRIVYGMYQMKATGSNHIKAQAIAGNISGTLHPHADSAISGAMARLAQGFTMRVPLIDPVGSVGIVSGDTAAAPRYWEAALSKAAELLIEEVNLGTVEIVPNYDGTTVEPIELPVKWPTAIINGTQGIAVGYASKMPTHNPGEIMDACIALLHNPEMTVDELMEYVPGPDFPTGGTIIGTDGIKEYIETGVGTFINRGKYEIHKESRNRHSIEFYELPYQISAEQVIQRIKSQQERQGRFKGISEIKDLTDKDSGLRLVIYVKAGVNPNKVVQDLFQWTPCESSFSVNSTILIDDLPVTAGLLEQLSVFVEFRKDCIINRSKTKSDKLKEEVHKLAGILKILLDIDKAIKIIRNAATPNKANIELRKAFKIDKDQADHILNLSLRRLTKSDSHEIQKKSDDLEKEIKKLDKIVKSPKALRETLESEFIETKKVIDDERRTLIEDLTVADVAEEKKEVNRIQRELSKDIPVFIYERNGKVIKKIEEDGVPLIETTSKSDLMSIDSKGLASILPVEGLSPIEPTQLHQSVLGFFPSVVDETAGVLIVTNYGNINIFYGEVRPDTNTVNLLPGEKLVYARYIEDERDKDLTLLMVNEDNKSMRIDLPKIRKTRAGSGTVIGMRGGFQIRFAALVSGDEILYSTNGETEKYTKVSTIANLGRGAGGSRLISLKKDEVFHDEFKLMTKEETEGEKLTNRGGPSQVKED